MLNKLKNAVWTKVRQLKTGAIIAIEKDGKLDWDEVVSIKKVGREQVYDIEVEGTHNFVGNGIIAHNTMIAGNIFPSAGSTYNLGDGTYPWLGAYLGSVFNTSGTETISITNRYLANGDWAVSTGGLHVGGTSAAGNDNLIVDGNVGIGTTSPTDHLDVRDSMRVINTDFVPNTTGSMLQVGLLTSSGDVSSYLQAYKTGASVTGNLSLQPIGGNVGIGTTGPGYKLDVSTNSNDAQYVRMYNAYAGTAAVSGFQADSNAAGGHVFATSGSYTSGTNVMQDSFNVRSFSTASNGLNLIAGGTGKIFFQTEDLAGPAMTITAGNVGIGTTAPLAKLNVVGVSGTPGLTDKGVFQATTSDIVVGIHMGGYTASPYATWIQSMDSRSGNSTTYPLALNPNGGNVGIGTTAPDHTLHVAGQFRFDGTENEEFTLVKIVQASDYIEAYSAADSSAVGINYFISTRASKMDFQPLDEFVDSNKIYDLNLLAYNYKADAPGTPKTIGLIADDTANTLPVITAFDSEGQPHHVRLELLGVLNTDQLQKIRKGLMVDETGNVGIGTTNPDYLLTMGAGGGYYNQTTGSWTNGSDISYKTNVSDLTKYGLETIKNLHPVSYTVKKSGVEQIGFIAQEVKNIIPELVSGQDGSMGLNYGGFTPILVKAIQEQQTEIASISAQLADIYLTDTGNFNIYQDQNGTSQLANVEDNTIVDRIGAFAKVLVANFQAGTAVINDLVADNLTVRTKLISPLADIDQLKVIDATVSGTLYADNIKGQTVDALNYEINLLNEKYSTASGILANLQAKYSTYDSLLGTISEATVSQDPSTMTDPLALSPLATSSAIIPQDLALNSLNVHTLIGNDIMANGAIFGNSISAFDSDLFIQPTGDKPVHLLANLMILYPDGKVLINGDLLVAGNILAKGLDIGSSTIASESAKFAQLTTNGLIIAADNNMATSSGTIETNANATIGTATIASGSSELSILNTKVTPSTLIYITPTSDTNGRVLFVKSKAEGIGFTVGLTESTATSSASFNYWLVETR